MADNKFTENMTNLDNILKILFNPLEVSIHYYE